MSHEFFKQLVNLEVVFQDKELEKEFRNKSQEEMEKHTQKYNAGQKAWTDTWIKDVTVSKLKELVDDFWFTNAKYTLLETLKQIFASECMQEAIVDISKDQENADFNIYSLSQAIKLLGDEGRKPAIIMHSKVYTELRKKEYKNVQGFKYHDFNVLLCDECPKENEVYTTYLLGHKAFVYANIETTLNLDEPGEIRTSQRMILHPLGLTYPKAKQTFEKQFNDAPVPIAAIKHKIA